MQGFKGLLPKNILTDEAFQPVYRKAQEHKKAAQICIDFFQQINKFFQSFSTAVQKCIQQSNIQNVKSSYYCLIGFVCTKLLFQNKNLTESTRGSMKQLTKLCNNIFDDFSKYLQSFQLNLRKYQQNQMILQQICKKYYRSHKNLLGSIDAYKISLTDVNFIYNVDEQIKRYQICESNYKTVISQHSAITQKSEALTQRKANIVKNYQQLKGQFKTVIKMIGSKVIAQVKNFFSYYCATNKNIITFLAQQKYNIQKQKFYTFMADIQDVSNVQHFKMEEVTQKHGKAIIPLIFQYPQLIKQQFLESYNSQMLQYLKKIQQGVERRKIQNKQVSQLFINYIKVIQKVHITGVKQITQNFDKLKKKITQSFGPRLASFMKSINSIFSISAGINQKLVKQMNPKLVDIQNLLNEESKLLKIFNDELKSNIQKFIGKRELKKLKDQQFSEQSSIINVASFRKQINQKAQFMKHLIQGFQQKMVNNCKKISRSYSQLLNDLSSSINQFYSLSLQYQQMYFGPQQFKKNFQIYQTDVQSIIQKSNPFFQELSLNVLKGDTNQIIFDGQIIKAEDFKKLKKPVLTQTNVQKDKSKQVQNKQQKSSDPKILNNQVNGKIRDSSPPSKKIQQIQKNDKQNNQIIQKSSRKTSTKQANGSIDQKQIKNYEFLMTKIQFKDNEQYIKSFSCALSEKIVLQGRIYITSQRICFNSGFNSNNLFFGGTFITFPKQDITKVQKRSNSLFLDNSISFTTVKGQLFFTSFFSRNEAYDLICKTFQISLDQHVYQYDQNQIKAPEMVVEIKQDDDMKQDEIPGRTNSIQNLLTKFQYAQIIKTQVIKQGLTAYQIFRIFYCGNQIQMNRRKYTSFLLYVKQLIGHKEVQIETWDPPLQKIMNHSNIKTNSSEKLTRKIRATVPVANSGVPFMPKTAKSQQIQNYYFYSKHKFVLQTQISTSGAPYTDTFKVQLRQTFISDEKGKCQITVGLFINFVKSTMMKSVIESKSKQESIKATGVWIDQMKKYFIQQAKSQSSAKNKQDPMKQLKQQIQLKATQIDEIKKQNQKLKQQIKNLKEKNQLDKKIKIGLVAALIILILILLT